MLKCIGYIKLLSPGKDLLIDRVVLLRTFREKEMKGNSEHLLPRIQMSCGLCLQVDTI